MQIQRSIETTARPAAVFAYLSDFTTTNEWDPGTVRTTRVSGDGGVGTTYHNVSKFAGRKPMIVVSAVAMGVMLAVILNVTPSVGFTVGLFCVLAVSAAFRSTGTSTLGLHQLPERSGSMMAARTTSAQLGYMLGALAGGAIIALSGFGLLGFALLAVMLVSAALLARVHDPHAETTERGPRLPEAVPD